MDKQQEDLAIRLFEAGAIQFGFFTFKIHEQYPDFPLSPNKINLRVPENGGNLTPELISGIAWEMWKKALIASFPFDLIVGLPRAGEPLAEAVAAYTHRRPLLKMSKQTYSGNRFIAEVLGNNYQAGQRVLVFDDVISQAQTKLEGVAAIKSVGLKIAAIIIVVDREEGGLEYLQSEGYRVYSVYTFSDLLKLYHRAGKITQRRLEESLAYSEKAKQYFLKSLI
jgi:orotate phosphoribosyltransferase